MVHVHGGPDALGVPRWDFSTNANACGPCPQAWEAVQQADARHYPDPAYAALRTALAAFHGVDEERIVLAGSASEFIGRVSAAVAFGGGHMVWLPDLAYGDYAQAARAWGLVRTGDPARAHLRWLCEPSSPLGLPEALADKVVRPGGVVVVDRAYEPLRLSGCSSLDADALARVWRLWTPNKALGLTGVRGAYAIAPKDDTVLTQRLAQLAPSWPLGAHAVAMMSSWVQPETQAWLTQSRTQLALWKTALRTALLERGWHVRNSEANYFCARAPRPIDALHLRAQGIKLRDTTSMGLPRHWRLGVLPLPAQAALLAALALQLEINP